MIPVAPDNVIGLYGRFDPTIVHSSDITDLAFARRFVDSLNAQLDEASRFDTFAIGHAIENFGNAVRSGKTIDISSSYFIVLNVRHVIHSVLTHEYKHIFREKLPV